MKGTWSVSDVLKRFTLQQAAKADGSKHYVVNLVIFYMPAIQNRGHQEGQFALEALGLPWHAVNKPILRESARF